MNLKNGKKKLFPILAVASLLAVSAITLVTAQTAPADIDDTTPLFGLRTGNAIDDKEEVKTNYLNQNTEEKPVIEEKEKQPLGWTWESSCGGTCESTCSGDTCSGPTCSSNTCSYTCPYTCGITCEGPTCAQSCSGTCSGYTCEYTSCQATCDWTCANTCSGQNTCNWPCI